MSKTQTLNSIISYVKKEYNIDPFDKKYKLIPELIPQTSWFENARKHFEKEWPMLKRECYKSNNYCCEICGGKGEAHPVEAHEVWDYNEKSKVQTLVRLQALCPDCHKVKHAGLWIFIKKRKDIVLNHMMKVNGINEVEATKLINAHLLIHSYRSNFNWTLDMSFLKNYDIKAEKYIFNNH